MVKWTGQLTLADFLHIKKPENTIKCKVYIPSYELQGEGEEISRSDVKNWPTTRQQLIDKFFRDFYFSGTYKDNKLNRRLNRVGKSFSHTKMLALMNVTNDNQLSKVQSELERVKEERRDFVLSKGFLLSMNVDELERNVSIESELEVEEIPVRARTGIIESVREKTVGEAVGAIKAPKTTTMDIVVTKFAVPPRRTTGLVMTELERMKFTHPQYVTILGEKIAVRPSDLRVEIPRRLYDKVRVGDTITVTYHQVD